MFFCRDGSGTPILMCDPWEHSCYIGISNVMFQRDSHSFICRLRASHIYIEGKSYDCYFKVETWSCAQLGGVWSIGMSPIETYASQKKKREACKGESMKQFFRFCCLEN